MGISAAADLLPAHMHTKRIMMVSFFAPCPPSAGNEQHLYRMLKWMKAEGYEVIFVLRSWAPITEEQVEELRQLVFRLHLVPRADEAHDGIARWRHRLTKGCSQWVNKLEKRGTKLPLPLLYGRSMFLEDFCCPPSLVKLVALLARQYRPFAVMAQYIFMSRCFQGLDPAILRLVDTHDMFSTRREKVSSHGIEDVLAISAAEERRMLDRADVIMTSQIDEARAMEQLGLQQRIFVIAIDMELPKKLDTSREVPGRLLIVAGDNQPNLLGVQRFLSCAWPLIHARYPPATLQLVGKVTRHISEREVPPGVTLTGFVRELADAYAEAQIAINPVYAGSGLKIKSLEALSYGKALISWPNGTEGMKPGVTVPWKQAAYWPQFAEHADELLNHPELRRDLGRRALDFIRANYTSEVIYRPLKEILQRRTAR